MPPWQEYYRRDSLSSSGLYDFFNEKSAVILMFFFFHPLTKQYGFFLLTLWGFTTFLITGIQEFAMILVVVFSVCEFILPGVYIELCDYVALCFS